MPNLSRVEHFIQAVGSYEDKIFQKRARLHQRQSERIKREKAQAKRGDDIDPQIRPDQIVPVARYQGSRLASGASPSPYQRTGLSFESRSALSVKRESQVGQSTTSMSLSGNNDNKGSQFRAKKIARLSEGASVGAAIVDAENSLEVDIHGNKEELKAKLKELLREKSDAFNSENPEEDTVKLGEPGWKERYYEEKFSAKTSEEIEVVRKDVVLKYTEGLCWVMHYYYEGVCSWQWFYPYHYAPFASDLMGLDQMKISFNLGSPFKPFNQLMGVFPAASSHALPLHYRSLMSDPNSPIIDFYPTDFVVDMNGKRFAWQGIAKLPFIDETRLLAEIEKVELTLTDEEIIRNSVMFDMFFVNVSHPLSPSIFSLNNHFGNLSEKERAELREKIDAIASGGMNGYLSLCNGDPCPPLFRSPVQGMEDILDNQVICCIYKLPDGHKHITRPPPGVILPKKTVTVGDLKPPPILWHEDTGRRPFENGRQNPNGAIQGRHLGEASHRLVMNSLQVNDRSTVEISRDPRGQYHNGRRHYVDHRSGHRPEYHPHWNPTGNHSDNGTGRGHWYGPPASSSPHHERPSHHHPPPNRPISRDPRSDSYRPHPHPYPYHSPANRPFMQPPPAADPYNHPRGGYNGAHGAYHQHHDARRGPPLNRPPSGRGYGYHQQVDNRYSALGRGSNRRPPPPTSGYGQY